MLQTARESSLYTLFYGDLFHGDCSILTIKDVDPILIRGLFNTQYKINNTGPENKLVIVVIIL